MGLQEVRGAKVLPTVKEVVKSAKDITEAGSFSKVTTESGEEFYYLTDSEVLIDTNPEDFVIRHSVKHGADFIVPMQSTGFTKF